MKKYAIEVCVETAYLEQESSPDENQFVFAYTISIHNAGSVAAQLLSRHWIITNADNKVYQVQGEGVIGEQPYLEPGQTYQYTSGAMIDTPVGTMQGSYHMVAADGALFEAEISPFILAMPNKLH